MEHIKVLGGIYAASWADSEYCLLPGIYFTLVSSGAMRTAVRYFAYFCVDDVKGRWGFAQA